MIYRTEVDGVPTLVAATSGPLHAGLSFRVGRADETVARAGITHLIEHLALHRHGLTDYHFNGATGPTVTHFHMQGAENDVVAFIDGVCQALSDLPYDRLETEKSILRTEEAGRGSGANHEMPLWRYGARGYGLLSFPEWGAAQLTAEDLWHWTRSWFTRENAVLWIAGPAVPAGLRLRLPSGQRRPLPLVTSALPGGPAYFPGSGNSVVCDTVVQRRMAATVFSGVLERDLFRALRQDGGYSYTAATSYDSRGDGFATVTALADALPDQSDAVLGGFIDALMRMHVGTIEPADIAAVQAKTEESLRHPEVYATRLPAYATDLLTGYPSRSVEAIRDELRAVTIADVHAVAVEAMQSVLLMTPQCRSAEWAGFTAAPTHSTAAATGPRYVSRDNSPVSLIVGPHEVGMITPDGPVTVRYDRCAAQLVWPDGGRQLVGDDGLVVRVEPTLFILDGAATAMLDAGVPADAVVRMPARDPSAIPQPRPATPPGAAGGGSGGRSWLETATLVVLGLFVALTGCAGALGTLGVASDDSTGGGEWAVDRGGLVRGAGRRPADGRADPPPPRPFPLILQLCRRLRAS